MSIYFLFFSNPLPQMELVPPLTNRVSEVSSIFLGTGINLEREANRKSGGCEQILICVM